MNSSISHKIKHREKGNDIFITPLPLAKQQIDLIDNNIEYKWLDPCANSGNYYKQFPKDNKKDYCEILEDKDFFEYNEEVDVICSNPPYSIIDKWIDKTIELNPKIFSYLLGHGALTTRRLEKIENAGYGITKYHLCKVFKWYGMTTILQFEKGKESIFTFDRTIWR